MSRNTCQTLRPWMAIVSSGRRAHCFDTCSSTWPYTSRSSSFSATAFVVKLISDRWYASSSVVNAVWKADRAAIHCWFADSTSAFLWSVVRMAATQNAFGILSVRGALILVLPIILFV